MADGFFAPYAYLGFIYFMILILISLFAGFLLKKIINKKWTITLTIIASCIIIYLFDLGNSSLIIGIFFVSVLYLYFFKTKIFLKNNSSKNEKN